MLKLIDAGYGYTPQTIAIENISLSFLGGLNVLCGPNGSGKSTLLRLLAGQISPRKGQALIDGKPAADIPRAKERLSLRLFPS